jgi:hypothetical protein
MPWTSRPRSRDPGARLRRWRYDNSESLRAFIIGAAIIAATLLGLAVLRMFI